MDGAQKTKTQLIEELAELRRKVNTLTPGMAARESAARLQGKAVVNTDVTRPSKAGGDGQTSEAQLSTAVMARMLRDQDAVEATSGDEDRKVFKADRAFHWVLRDMMMPRISGVELHGWLMTTNPGLAKQILFIGYTTGGPFTPKAREYLTKVGGFRLEKRSDVANSNKTLFELIFASRSKSRFVQPKR